MKTKACIRCEKIKPVSEFHNRSKSKDGKNSKCKECISKYSAMLYEKHAEVLRKRSADYRSTDHGKSVCTKYRSTDRAKELMRKAGRKFDSSEYGKRKRKEYRKSDVGRKIQLECVKRHQADNPQQLRASSTVNNAVQSGRLIRPDKCSACGKSGTIDAHHHSYKEEDWLNVTWLCRKCHRQLHIQQENTYAN